jgi:uncharacterized membrane protein YobD (UPF0266 family)
LPLLGRPKRTFTRDGTILISNMDLKFFIRSDGAIFRETGFFFSVGIVWN